MQFRYKAIDQNGKTVDGLIEATDQRLATAALRKASYRPIVVKPESTGFKLFSSTKGKKMKKDDLVIFTRQLSAMISAGVPLLRSLTSLSKKGDTQLMVAIRDIVNEIEGGASFADALAKHSDIFDPIYSSMVRAGETAGILDDILKRLALQQEKSATIRKKIKSAMAYPTVLMGITVVAFFGLMIFVIPKIGEITKNMTGGESTLPLITEVMLAISNFTISWWFILIPGLVGLVVGTKAFIKTPKGKTIYDQVILKIPKLNQILIKIIVSRFTRTFSALIGAGVPVTGALQVTADAVGNEVYKKAVLEAVTEIKNGKQLSEAIEMQGNLWPYIVSQMLAVGEETGNTDTVIVKIADFYDEEVDLAIDKISSIIEPVMILVMGTMVGLIAASVMSPIAGLSKGIK